MEDLFGKNCDASIPPPMHVGDLYRKKLNQANNFRRLAEDEERTEIIRSHFRDRAFRLESEASYVAHCLALFGNEPFTSMDFEKCLSEVEGMTCEECNPWARGLTLIREEIIQSTNGQS